MSTLFVSKRLSIAPGARLSGEWQDISDWESGLVKTNLELLEKELDGLLDPLGKATIGITQRLPDPPWPLPRQYQASFGHYQDTLATATSKRKLPQPMSLDGSNRVQLSASSITLREHHCLDLDI